MRNGKKKLRGNRFGTINWETSRKELINRKQILYMEKQIDRETEEDKEIGSKQQEIR